MSQYDGPVGFGVYLRDAIYAAGFTTPTQFARSVGTDPSVVLRWISGDQRPTIKSIERVACVLGRSINEIVVAAYPDRLGRQAIPATPIHPLAYELGRILADDSPVPAAEREALVSVLVRLLDPYRRELRRRRTA
jgi:transcriptional regulator with XRE-family HTH domain